MRIGIVVLPTDRWSEQARRWRQVEEYGFDHAWTYDHLTWDKLAEKPWGATIPTLVAAATVTARIPLGTWVASPNYRHPVPFARDLAALDDISDGRLLVGLGAGGTGLDATVLGGDLLEPAERAARFEEFVDLLDAVLTCPATTHRGRWYQATDARTDLPGPPRPRPPFVIAANGPRMMRLAVRQGASWATTGNTSREDGDAAWWRGLAGLAERFTEISAGRPDLRRFVSLDSAPTFSLTSLAHFEDVVGRAAELGFTDVVTHWPVPGGAVYDGDEAILDDVAALFPRLCSGVDEK